MDKKVILILNKGGEWGYESAVKWKNGNNEREKDLC